MASRTEVFTQIAVTSLLLNAGLALVQAQLVAKAAGTAEAVFVCLISVALLAATYAQIRKLFGLPESAWVDKAIFKAVVIAWVVASSIRGAVQLFAIASGGHALLLSIYGLLAQLPFAIGIRRKMVPAGPDNP